MVKWFRKLDHQPRDFGSNPGHGRKLSCFTPSSINEYWLWLWSSSWLVLKIRAFILCQVAVSVIAPVLGLKTICAKTQTVQSRALHKSKTLHDALGD